MRFLFFLILTLFLPLQATAQGAATLVADEVTLNGQDQLIASGNVEVFFEGNRLTASRIVYDRNTDSLQITGPIILQTTDGNVLLADSATLDPQLENGVLQSARIVLDQQLQLVANQIDRREGRYAQLYKTSATSCRVCGDRPPLWEIRAERVVHDTEARQLYFTNATFRVRGMPLFWLPRMRLPDPTLDRVSGFLIPDQRTSTRLGVGIKLPYFITLGDHRDLTLTPYLSRETTTLEARYRQAFRNGDIQINGAVSDDTLEDARRSYAFLRGNFTLADDYQLRFDVETVSDVAYLREYGYSDKDRLDSAVELLRIADRSLFQSRLSFYRTLREDETNASLPPVIGDIRYEARHQPAFGGTLRYGASMDAAYRDDDTDGEAGRDMLRIGAKGAWAADRVLPGGLVLAGEVGARADLFAIADDSSFPDRDTRLAPYALTQLRWPLAATGPLGGHNLLEPVISLSWSDNIGAEPPNEDSTRAELDRANLFAASRYPGEDAMATGTQLAVGMVWTRVSPGGMTSTIGAGRILRNEVQPGFTASSGLDGLQSDWLLAAQLTAPKGFILDARSLWDDNDSLTVADARLTWQRDDLQIAANYIWQRKDPGEGRDDTISEWSFDSAFDISTAWTLSLDGRYDVAADRPVSGGVGLRWQNECVIIDFSADRSYTRSSTVAPTTTFGISGTITGFSAGRAAGGITTGCES